MTKNDKKFFGRKKITRREINQKEMQKEINKIKFIYFTVLLFVSVLGLYEVFTFATPPEDMTLTKVEAKPVYRETEILSPYKDEVEIESSFIIDEIEEDYLDDSLSVEEEEPIMFECNKTGYLTANLNVRENPSTESNIYEVLPWNKEIKYAEFDSNWVVIEYDDTYAFLYKAYISDKPSTYKSLEVDGDKRKSYMDWKAITSKRSKQYKLQATKAYTASNGIRAVNDRYCVALGSYYSHNVGQYVDIVLENELVIPCIVADCKKDIDTDSGNKIGNDGGAVEFVVSTDSLNKKSRRSGDVSNSTEGWNSNVVEIRIYDYNVF